MALVSESTLNGFGVAMSNHSFGVAARKDIGTKDGWIQALIICQKKSIDGVVVIQPEERIKHELNALNGKHTCDIHITGSLRNTI